MHPTSRSPSPEDPLARAPQIFGARSLSHCLLLAGFLGLSGCWVGDGRIVVRGTVLGPMHAPRPLQGATVTVGEPKANERVATTLDDGRFTAIYRYGGMFPFDTDSRDPTVTVTAPGYLSVSFPLEDTRPHPQIRRGSCQPPQYDCFVFDIFLVPQPTATPAQ